VAIHEFEASLEFSEQASEEAFWDAVYRAAFPNMVSHMSCPGDTESQRLGVDRVILLDNAEILKIDEKKRRGDWPDVLLEYLSNDRTGAPGWIEKNLRIDYLAYAFPEARRCYLIPWPGLRAAWKSNGADWKLKFPRVEAQNRDYKTLSVAVPVKVLYRAVNQAMWIDLEECDGFHVPGDSG
jgi:hypothetical protein